MSHDECTSVTSRILTVTTLQRLKVEALVPAPADYDVFNAQSIAPIEIHSQLCHVSGNTPRRSTHLLQDFAREVFNHPPYRPDLAPSDFHLILHLKKFLSAERQGFQNNGEVPIPGGRLLRHRMQKLVPRYDKCLSSGGEYVEK